MQWETDKNSLPSIGEIVQLKVLPEYPQARQIIVLGHLENQEDNICTWIYFDDIGAVKTNNIIGWAYL